MPIKWPHKHPTHHSNTLTLYVFFFLQWLQEEAIHLSGPVYGFHQPQAARLQTERGAVPPTEARTDPTDHGEIRDQCQPAGERSATVLTQGCQSLELGHHYTPEAVCPQCSDWTCSQRRTVGVILMPLFIVVISTVCLYVVFNFYVADNFSWVWCVCFAQSLWLFWSFLQNNKQKWHTVYSNFLPSSHWYKLLLYPPLSLSLPLSCRSDQLAGFHSVSRWRWKQHRPSGEAGCHRWHEPTSVSLLYQLITQHVPHR